MTEDSSIINDLSRCLGRVEGKMDGIITRLDRINSLIDGHEDRINKVEDGVANIKGAATLFGAGAGITITILWDFIKGKLFE